ncbi:hypothetical protein [Nitrospira sp. BLG_2]
MTVAWVQHVPRRSFLITIEHMAVYRTVRSIAPRRNGLLYAEVNLSAAG